MIHEVMKLHTNGNEQVEASIMPGILNRLLTCGIIGHFNIIKQLF